MQSRFELVVVIGCGKIAGDVVQYAGNLRKRYGYEVLFLQHESKGESRIQTICRENRIPYEPIKDRDEMTLGLSRIRKPALIISAGNYYLFPKCIIEKPNLEIINFHNALLPRLPGRNAPTWAIYLEEEVSGPTWHYVEEDIDRGRILAQESMVLTEDIKAYELTKAIMELAFTLFQTFYEELLLRPMDGVCQPENTGKRKIYYSYELPNGGVCTMNMEGAEIYRILRSMDYGKNGIFPPPRIEMENNKYVTVLRYSKKERKHCFNGQAVMDSVKQCLYFGLNETYELEIKYKKEI